MSVQFGECRFDGQPEDKQRLERARSVLAPYSPDSDAVFSRVGISILYRPFHTTNESHREIQPHTCSTGAVLTWDGRLDNRSELVEALGGGVNLESTDVAIVAAAYERWETRCFAKLVGDWALSIWRPLQHSIILAKDAIGMRHLYYLMDKEFVIWSTILDAIALLAGKPLGVCEEYIAGWLVHLPAEHLTPYAEIRSVPASSFVLIRDRKLSVIRYWDFDPAKRIRYRSNGEYDEHFRTVFSTAVRRRLRADRPVLAELSGGIDSSSIVCVADTVMAAGEAETPRIDTISYYDDSSPYWNERPYLNVVEHKRGRTGYHIDLGTKSQSEIDLQDTFLNASHDSCQRTGVPEPNYGLWPVVAAEYIAYVKSQGYRVTLSGIAGEVATGGFVPTPRPELQNLLTRARFYTLFAQLNAWASAIHKSAVALLGEAVRGLLTRSLPFPGPTKSKFARLWFEPDFIRRNEAALHRYPARPKVFGPLPSFQNQIQLVNHERRFVASCQLSSELLREVRYPYLDRDLLEFSCAVPIEQMVGVGKRRQLMKRALAGIVPDEVLERKRREISTQQQHKRATKLERLALPDMGSCLISHSLGIVEQNLYGEALRKYSLEQEVPIDRLNRTLQLELWLRHLAREGILRVPSGSERSRLLWLDEGSSNPEVSAQKFG